MLNILFFLLGIITGIIFYKIKFKSKVHNMKESHKKLVLVISEAIYDRRISKLEYENIKEKIIDVDINLEKFF